MVASATPSEATPAPATGSAEVVSPVFGAVPSFFVSVTGVCSVSVSGVSV